MSYKGAVILQLGNITLQFDERIVKMNKRILFSSKIIENYYHPENKLQPDDSIFFVPAGRCCHSLIE